MKTQFRPVHQWPQWRPDQDALRALVDLVDTTWPEPSAFSLTLTRPERIDTADALAAATAIDVMVLGSTGLLDSITFWWNGTAASVAVAGSDSLVAAALRNSAAEILQAGAYEPDEVLPLVPSQRMVQRETKLPLRRVRFVGTYASVHHLIHDLAEQVRQVRGTLDYVYVALTEPGTTITIHHLNQLDEITGRDVHRLRHLTISLGSRADGPSLSLYITVGRVARLMSGDVAGPDEAPVRTLRAAGNDLLRDRGAFPYWVFWAMSATAVVLELIGTGLQFFGDIRPLGWALFATGVVLVFNPLYLPPVELLGEEDKTRWSRSWRYIVTIVVAWLVASSAIPIFSH